VHLVSGSSVQTVYSHALSLSLSEDSKIVYQLPSATRTLVSALHVFPHHSKRRLSVVDVLFSSLILL